jgi:hypothetical protein
VKVEVDMRPGALVDSVIELPLPPAASLSSLVASTDSLYFVSHASGPETKHEQKPGQGSGRSWSESHGRAMAMKISRKQGGGGKNTSEAYEIAPDLKATRLELCSDHSYGGSGGGGNTLKLLIHTSDGVMFVARPGTRTRWRAQLVGH